MQDQYSALLNCISENFSLYLVVEREYICIFDQLMDKETVICFWKKLSQVFTSATLKEITKQLFIKKVGMLILEEPFQVFPVSPSLLKMVSQFSLTDQLFEKFSLQYDALLRSHLK